MAEFHYVEDYEKHVAKLVEQHGLDEGMSLAVGGNYGPIGAIQANILIHLGLKDGMTLADIGCGSGRTAAALGSRVRINYDGFDIVQSLLDYARHKSPSNYRFILNRGLTIPSPDEKYDFICAFSLFTHLLHEETYIYLEDTYRTLKAGGILVFSFLEFRMEGLWPIFQATINGARNSTRPHLNMFIERNAIEVMARKIGFIDCDFYDATEAIVPQGAMGQSIAVLKK